MKGIWHDKPIGEPLFDGGFTWPVMVARRSALEHNIATMAEYCARHGVDLAPHGKTTMAPALFEAQLTAGAWGITVATAQQALIAHHGGVQRILIANELLDPTALRWAATRPGELLYYLDSVAGVRASVPGPGVRVLIELGYAAGRTGCRTIDEVVLVAEAASAAGLSIAGVAGYEGGLETRAEVDTFLGTMRAAYLAIERLCDGDPIVTAGGSGWFDAVVDGLTGDWAADAGARTPRVVLRSGAYISHDHGIYRERTPFNRVDGELVPALELWAQVLSTPEPGLALVGFGKRDAPFDAGLPVPLTIRGSDGASRPATGATVTALNDQHAYLTGLIAEPGELVCFGISHPCTAFDKWRTIPVIDDTHRVVDLLETHF